MTQPLLAKLKEQFPQSKIDVLATTWVAPIYRACSEVSEVIEAKFEHKQLQWNLRKQLAQELSKKNYQACFVLPNSFKSALIPWLANIPLRIGYRGEWRFGLINLTLENPSKINRPPMVEHYLALSGLLNDEQGSLANHQAPKLHVSENAKQSILNKLLKSNIDPASTYIMCPGAEYGPSKRWPTDHFAELIQKLVSFNPSAQIILLGGKADQGLAAEICIQAQLTSNLHNWCGSTTLDEAIALIGMSNAVISNDSGLMHVAAALQTPQIAIFGSSDPAHTPPISSKAKVLWLNLPCSPCHKKECPLGHLNCLNNILPDQVFATLKTLQP